MEPVSRCMPGQRCADSVRRESSFMAEYLDATDFLEFSAVFSKSFQTVDEFVRRGTQFN
jgi:hypothetical protein